MNNPIINPPPNTIVTHNSNEQLSPTINHDPNFSYQWSRSTLTYSPFPISIIPRIFIDIPEATNISLNIPSDINNDHLYWYRLEITDRTTNKTFSTHPVQVGVLPDTNSLSGLNITGLSLYAYAHNFQTTLRVETNGSYTYTWQKLMIVDPQVNPNKQGFVTIASNSSNTLELNNLKAEDHSSIYRVIVSGLSNYGVSSSWTSPLMTVIVDPAISILYHNLKDFTVPSNGQKQLFAIPIARNGTILYSWQKSVNGSDYTDIPNQNNPSISLSNLTVNDVGTKYRLKMVPSFSKIYTKYSDEASIVNPSFSANSLTNIQILSQSSNTSITQTGVSLFVEAQSQSPLSYQWLKSSDQIEWSNIPNSTGSAITINFVNFENKTEYYKCQISSNSGSVVSDIIPLNLDTDTYVVNQPSGISVTNSGSLSCRFFANNTGVFSYEWYRYPIFGYNTLIKANYSSAINQISNNIFESKIYLTGLNYQNNDADRYILVAKNIDDQKIKFVSSQASVSVENTITVHTGLPSLFRIPAGNSGSLSINVSTSAPPLSYQWYRSTNSGLSFEPVSGAISNSLAINPASVQDNKSYYIVEVTDSINRLVLPS